MSQRQVSAASLTCIPQAGRCVFLFWKVRMQMFKTNAYILTIFTFLIPKIQGESKNLLRPVQIQLSKTSLYPPKIQMA